MEEKILEIIKTNRIFLQGHSELCAKEITAHVREFIEWIGINYGFNELSLREMDMKWIYPIEPVSFSDEFTTDELFQYWLDNVKDK